MHLERDKEKLKSFGQHKGDSMAAERALHVTRNKLFIPGTF